MSNVQWMHILKRGVVIPECTLYCSVLSASAQSFVDEQPPACSGGGVVGTTVTFGAWFWLLGRTGTCSAFLPTVLLGPLPCDARSTLARPCSIRSCSFLSCPLLFCPTQPTPNSIMLDPIQSTSVQRCLCSSPPICRVYRELYSVVCGDFLSTSTKLCSCGDAV